MTLAILVAPTGAQPLPTSVEQQQAASPWYRLGMTWTGANGVSFDLRGQSGVRLILGGVIGLLNPPVELRTSATPARGGGRLRDVTVGEREVFWPLLVYTDAGSQAWQNLNEKLFSSLSTDYPGVWEVTRVDGSQRRLKVHFKDDGGSLERDPLSSGWARYPISGVALDPYWTGDDITSTFGQATGSGSLPGPGRPLGSGSTVGSATMDNPGDVESYPRFLIEGPTTSVSVGVTIGGVIRSITVPFTIPDGGWVSIDTDTHAVRDNTGASRRKDLSSAYFVPIPAGSSVPMNMTMNGTGRVTVTLTPRYKRAI